MKNKSKKECKHTKEIDEEITNNTWCKKCNRWHSINPKNNIKEI